VTAAEVAGMWLGLIYAHPDRPPAMQRDVLAALAVDKRLAGRDPDTRRACSVGDPGRTPSAARYWY
jgi:hypothetical protein